MSPSQYPPILPENQLSTLASTVKDWQLNQGSLLKLVGSEEDNSVLARQIGVTLWPSLFPRAAFEEARQLCCAFNELYAAVAEDEVWLFETLKDIFKTNRLAACLWSIHEQVKQDGYAQDIVLGIFRSDYMLHESSPSDELQMKQVEFNAYSCAGGVHASRVSDMHRYLYLSGAYPSAEFVNLMTADDMPQNKTIDGLTKALHSAHDAYNAHCSLARGRKSAVLFVVQPNNVNICDERPLEYALWNQTTPVPAYQVIFGQVSRQCSLGPAKELLFTPDVAAEAVEISTVYLRAGYDADEYDDIGRASRYLLERSRAIKCPSILSHLSTFKNVQEALSQPGAIERFLDDPSKVKAIRRTFVPMYPLHKDSGLCKEGLRLALDEKTAPSYILKPSLEGGSHNIHGEEILAHARQVPVSEWNQYILMQRICSPTVQNILMSPLEMYEGPTISELGIFGSCLWRRKDPKRHAGRAREMLLNQEAGLSLKTKPSERNEMSVVKGYGCFSSPLLVDTDTWKRYASKEDPEPL
ncbi:MAG: hypothetical protein M1828_006923 [Chrysothrix sp. TS-e1954]|nr:MAG: hypothetical protein M1828_006923 [Chrysothrix sp. TS-e1954]